MSFLPEEVHGKEIVALAIFFIGLQPYAAWQQTFDPLLTKGARNYWKSHNFTEFSVEAIDQIVDYAGNLPSPQCEIFIGQLGGKASRISSDATAYSHRDAQFVMNVHGRWEDSKDDDFCIKWAKDFFKTLEP